jgi:hypothetical protein
MAIEDIEITENGYLMIHDPRMEQYGDGTVGDHAQAVDILGKMRASMVEAYKRKTGKSEEEVLAVMAKETWVNAKEALAAGYVNRITAPKQARIAAKSSRVPRGVIESLSGDIEKPVPVTTKDEPMSKEDVAATIEEIEAKFPKMPADRVLACLKKKLPIASVMTEALGAMEEEMNGLRAKLAEYEQKMVAMETKPEAMEEMEEEPAEAKAKAMDEEPEMKAKAKAKAGVRPVAKATGSARPSALVRWNQQIEAKVAKGLPKAKAASMVNKENPGLREQMLEEVNAA